MTLPTFSAASIRPQMLAKATTTLLPSVIAHRGARNLAPENTIPALRVAKKIGSSFAEVDVMLTRDKKLIVHHDQTLERCSNGRGAVKDIDFEDLRKLDAGSWFSEEYSGTFIPTLAEVLQVCKELDLGLNVEIKHQREKADEIPTPEQAEQEREIARATCEVMKELQVDAEKVVISSFSVQALEVCHAELPNIRRSLLVEAIPITWAEDYERLDCSSLNFNAKKTTEVAVNIVHKHAVPMFSYTVNDPQRAAELLSWGVSGVFTDCPDKIQEYLASKAISETVAFPG